jgi:hypothetical protein
MCGDTAPASLSPDRASKGCVRDKATNSGQTEWQCAAWWGLSHTAWGIREEHGAKVGWRSGRKNRRTYFRATSSTRNLEVTHVLAVETRPHVTSMCDAIYQYVQNVQCIFNAVTFMPVTDNIYIYVYIVIYLYFDTLPIGTKWKEHPGRL